MKTSVKALLNIVKMLISILSPKQRIDSIWVFLSMILCALLDLVSVSLMYPFLSLITDSSDLSKTWYLKWIYYLFPSIERMHVIIIVAFLIMLIFIVKNVLAIQCVRIQYRFAAGFHRDSSKLMLESYMERPYEFFVNTNSSIILRGIEGDTSCVYETLISIFHMFSDVITVILIGIYLMYSDWLIALMSLALMGISFLSTTIFFKDKAKNAGIQLRESTARKNKESYQSVIGIKEILVMNRKKDFIDKYGVAAEKYAEAYEVYGTISASPDRIMEGICMSGFIAILIVRLMSGLDMNSFVPVMGVFAMGAFKLLPSVSRMSTQINNIVTNQFGVKGCYENITEARNLAENKEKKKKMTIEKSTCITGNMVSEWNSLNINNISWKYQNSTNNVLEDLSLTISKGQSIAFIGPSGAGKSTLADIILGLLKPQKGTVMLDDIDIFGVPEIWSKIIGFVPQMVFLLDDTIRANIAFGLPDELVDDGRIWASLRDAQLEEFVKKLPQQLDTIVGERGIKFSGGQRQRIAIARALYNNPDILVFDEATSALDTETETAVMESINALQGYKTLIIIAHRLTTIRNCDIILKIENGVAVPMEKESLF